MRHYFIVKIASQMIYQIFMEQILRDYAKCKEKRPDKTARPRHQITFMCLKVHCINKLLHVP